MSRAIRRKSLLLPVVLFILTFFTTLLAGAVQTGVHILKEPEKIYKGLPFALTLMAILLSHELAHYFTSKKYNVKATLPYFIPAPTIIGTFGAVIKMKSPIVTRKALVDIGVSGPIAGFIVSVIVSIAGLSFSKVVPLKQVEESIHLGDSLLFTLLSRVILDYHPGSQDVLLHPIAFAGWIGFFITFMNLIPVGQLDGGHIAYALLGEKHGYLSYGLVLVMVLLGLLLWEGWALWAILLLILGLRHPPILYWEVPLDHRRIFFGWLALVIFVITFIPVPFNIY